MTICDPDQDKCKERERYDERAITLSESEEEKPVGVESVAVSLRAPYLCYAEKLKKNITPQSKVLEIGAGTGEFTGILVQLATKGSVVATDISSSSLNLLCSRYNEISNLFIKVADMESLPFEDEFFDIVCCAGGLSYGDNIMVMNEIFRVIKSGGGFICVDSLNHNPIYRFNRWVHYKSGNRTLSTLNRMPTFSLINSYKIKFGSVESYYFGAISWAVPLLSKVLSASLTTSFCNSFDRLIAVKSSAFKFVMFAIKE
jgi:ubiquinone/menaquinone biosynthesis C-methylase UbiE